MKLQVIASAVLFAALIACGSPHATCSANTCATGCCDQSGQCQLSPTAAACGQGGFQCVACLGGQTCLLGICTGSTNSGGSGGSGGTGGGSGTCSGCWTAQGACVPLTSTTSGACGRNGATCSTCYSGQSCISGVCGSGGSGGGTASCNSSTCGGCCDIYGYCLAPTNSTCGVNGSSCSDCTSAAMTCDSFYGYCVSGAGGGTGGGYANQWEADTCAQATSAVITYSGTVTVYGNTLPLTADYLSGVGGSCNGNGSGSDAVYLISHSGSGSFTATASATAGSAYQPVLYLRSSCTVATDVACFFDGVCTAGTGTLTVPSLAPGTYYLIVDTCNASMGSYQLTLTQ